MFSDEVIKNYGKLAMFSNTNNVAQPEKQLGYEMKLPPQTYEQYKKMNQDRSGNNISANNLTKGAPRQIQSASNKEREKSLGMQNGHQNTNSQEPKSAQMRGADHQSNRPLTSSNSQSAKQASHK